MVHQATQWFSFGHDNYFQEIGDLKKTLRIHGCASVRDWSLGENQAGYYDSNNQHLSDNESRVYNTRQLLPQTGSRLCLHSILLFRGMRTQLAFLTRW